MGRKHCGKGRNCSSRAISPFPIVFSKGLFPRGSKGVIVWEWVTTLRVDNSWPKNIAEREQILTKTKLFCKPFSKQAFVLTCLHLKSFENTVGKEEIARNEQFLLFLTVFFQHFLRTLYPFHQTKNCRLQTLSVWKSPNFVVWERVKSRILSKN